MRPFAAPQASGPTRVGLVLVGLLSMASAAMCAGLAEPHASLCNAGQAAHCGWCYAQAGFTALAVAAGALCAVRPSPQPLFEARPPA